MGSLCSLSLDVLVVPWLNVYFFNNALVSGPMILRYACVVPKLGNADGFSSFGHSLRRQFKDAELKRWISLNNKEYKAIDGLPPGIHPSIGVPVLLSVITQISRDFRKFPRRCVPGGFDIYDQPVCRVH